MKGSVSSSFCIETLSKKSDFSNKKMFTIIQDYANIIWCEKLADVQGLDTPTGS